MKISRTKFYSYHSSSQLLVNAVGVITDCARIFWTVLRIFLPTLIGIKMIQVFAVYHGVQLNNTDLLIS